MEKRKKHIGLYCILMLLSIGTQAQLYMNGNVYVASTGIVYNTANTTIGSSGVLTNIGNIYIQGDINDSGTTGYDGGKLSFVGTTAQSTSGSVMLKSSKINFANTAGVTLGKDISVGDTCTFSSGIITTGSNALEFTSSGTYTGVSSQHHVNGYVRKLGTGSFSYPVGNGTKYQKVDANLSANASGMTVKYNVANAGTGTYLTTGASSTPLKYYNVYEYWDFTPVSTATGSVTITWDDYNNSGISDVSHLKVAHKTASGWANESGTGTGSVSAGSITSASVSTWSPFTLGSINNFSQLPLQWLDVSAKWNNNKPQVIWSVANEHDVKDYEVYKSNDGVNFTFVTRLSSNGNSVSKVIYTATDEEGFTSDAYTNYYKVKQIDYTGVSTESKICTLSKNKELSNTYKISMSPNPTNSEVTIKLDGMTADQRNSFLKIEDVSGRILLEAKYTEMDQIIDVSHFRAGIYFVKVYINDKTIASEKLLICR
ncbi:MAG: T9SS type A sorting domain-containing protein [Bacteroidetes bacterium]|nr:T9SS type A sorting domain-containing protein [Bacteroidota bacterium]